jgi:hypothetical protein
MLKVEVERGKHDHADAEEVPVVVGRGEFIK